MNNECFIQVKDAHAINANQCSSYRVLRLRGENKFSTLSCKILMPPMVSCDWKMQLQG